jgi:hypothetical protein
MKFKKVKNVRKVLVLLLLFLLLSACSTNKTNSSTNSDESSSSQVNDSLTSDSDISSASTDDEILSPEAAYKAVLENKVSFISTEDNQENFLNDYLSKVIPYDLKMKNITLIDLDGDQTLEVVLELSPSEYPQIYELLHYSNGKVYGYELPFRGFEYLKEDGTFEYASSSDDTGVGKIVNFNLSEVETEALAYSEGVGYNEEYVVSYFINNAPVTREDYLAFWEQQDAKQDVQWHEFSVENFEQLWTAGS